MDPECPRGPVVREDWHMRRFCCCGRGCFRTRSEWQATEVDFWHSAFGHKSSLIVRTRKHHGGYDWLVSLLTGYGEWMNFLFGAKILNYDYNYLFLTMRIGARSQIGSTVRLLKKIWKHSKNLQILIKISNFFFFSKKKIQKKFKIFFFRKKISKKSIEKNWERNQGPHF